MGGYSATRWAWRWFSWLSNLASGEKSRVRFPGKRSLLQAVVHAMIERAVVPGGLVYDDRVEEGGFLGDIFLQRKHTRFYVEW